MKMFVKTAVAVTFTAATLTFALSALTFTSGALAFQSVKSLYSSKCAVCHGNDGSANTAKGKELNHSALKVQRL
jgi:mono/diheme cytochrome c family protein